MTLRLSFLGGAGTVTGSKYLVECDDRHLLVDCGLFQGFKTLRLRNWAPFPIEPRRIDAVILTHAGPVFCSESTAEFCKILLPEAGYLQEKDAEYANRHGFSKHKPALPLYTQQDAIQALDHLKPIAFDRSLAHADADEIMTWLKGFKKAPRTTFIVHGEPTASDALRHRIEEELGWACVVPEQGEQAGLP